MEKNTEITLTNLLICISSFLVFKLLPNSKMIIPLCFILLIINSLRYFYEEQVKKVLDYIIKYRWIIALVIFVVLVFFRIHGSSIGVYNQIFGHESNIGELFGQGRPIRSDEFNVQVPYFFSQFYNDFQKNSFQMSLAGQDMIIGYNSPVLDLTLIGKPFVWGYILFGNEVGLSWYWNLKTILCVLVCFEMFKIITHNDYCSFFGSILLVFSPVMQWWFSPHMYDVFFWGMALFVVGYYFFMAKKQSSKWFFTIISACSLVGFVIALFPSLQIPVGLTMFVLLIGCIFRDKDNFTFNKKDALRMVTVVGIVVIVLGQFLTTSFDQIQLLYSTVYPGKRVSTGGDNQISDLFTSINVLFTPYYNPAESNACEISTFNHLGILCLFLFPYQFITLKSKNINNKSLIVGVILFIVLLIEISFMIIGFPEFLAKITLFSYINRMDIAYGFTATIFTIYTFNLFLDSWELYSKKIVLFIFGLFLFIGLLTSRQMIDPRYAELFSHYIYYVIVMLLGIMVFLLLRKKIRYALSFSMIWIFLTGFTINPVVIGTSAINSYDFVQSAIERSSDNDGYWLTTDSLHTQELLLANGLKVLNAVNFYPDYGKWNIVDPDRENEDIYNRYAHMQISLNNNSSTEYSIIYSDYITVDLDVNLLDDLNVKYLCTMDDYDALLNQAGIPFDEFYEKDGIHLYELL